MRIIWEKSTAHRPSVTTVYADLRNADAQRNVCSRTYLRQQTRSQKGNYGCEVPTKLTKL